MADQTQHRIGRNRPPRVQITYDVEIGDAVEVKELPFVVGIMADLAGDTTQKKFKERKFTQIERENFDEVMENIGPTKSVVRTSLEGGDILRLREWFQGRIPLILLEEHKEIEDVRPVRVHDARLLPLLIEQGMITEPAESGTWAAVLDSELDD